MNSFKVIAKTFGLLFVGVVYFTDWNQNSRMKCIYILHSHGIKHRITIVTH